MVDFKLGNYYMESKLINMTRVWDKESLNSDCLMFSFLKLSMNKDCYDTEMKEK